eukprot:5251988-Prymnesium_polylepis.2
MALHVLGREEFDISCSARTAAGAEGNAAFLRAAAHILFLQAHAFPFECSPGSSTTKTTRRSSWPRRAAAAEHAPPAGRLAVGSLQATVVVAAAAPYCSGALRILRRSFSWASPWSSRTTASLSSTSSRRVWPVDLRAQRRAAVPLRFRLSCGGHL